MTIREYITQKLSAYGQATDADLTDLSVNSSLDLDADYTADTAEAVGKAMAEFILGKALSSNVSSVSEGGFSMSWDWASLGKYYIWLCRKWGLDVDDEALALLGIPAIIDKTSIW